MVREWANLNWDLLRLIAGKHRTLEDFTRVGAVCSDWMNVHMELEGPICGPWLILPCDHDHDDPYQSQCYIRRCFSMKENKVHDIDFPEAYGKKCVGSSYGWLIMVEDVSPAIFMLNPLTKQRIELPAVTTMPEILGFNKEDVGEEFIVRCIFYGDIYRESLKDIERCFTFKIILSNDPEEDDCIVVALCGTLRRLVYCRIGDNKWTPVEHDLKPPQSDVVYSKGKFYAINCNAKVGVFDVRNAQVTTILDPPSRINECDAMYLAVDTSGSLLLISRCRKVFEERDDAERDEAERDDAEHDDLDHDESNYFYLTTKFKVFKLDEEKNEWTKVNDIGENVMFLGENGSVCYSTIELPEFKKNSIYFTHGEHLGGRYKGRDLGIFNIESGLIEKITCFKQDMPLHSILPPPIWFTPSIRSSSRVKTV